MKNPEIRKRISKTLKERNLPEEHKKKIREATKKAMQNLEIRKKIREARKKYFKDPENRKKMSKVSKMLWQDPEYIRKVHVCHDTKPERIVEQMLKELGIEYEKQKPIFGIPDFFVEPNYCIFVDGDYWHSQPEQIERDKEVNERLTKQGYVVLRFWEHEVYEKPERIREVLKNLK
jgi:G:T-mismatch repair DNA endonuclease (very short patch repair protein)